MRNSEVIKVAIAGAGKGGEALLEMFTRSEGVEVVGITDRDKKARGLKRAAELGVFVTEDVAALSERVPDVVINATGCREISEYMRSTFPASVEVMEGSGAHILWRLVGDHQKAKNELEGQFALEKKLRRELKEKNEELERLNEDLENKILERTRELEITNRELRKANELKNRFIANASHELRTPLNSIIGFSEILKEKIFGDLTEKQDKYVQNIYTSGRHLLHLVNNILDLAKIEAGKTELNIESFSVENVVDEVLTVLKTLSDRKEIDIVNSISGDLMLKADRIKLKQIFYNLLSNAIKFTPEKGKVGIRAERIGDGKTATCGVKKHEYVRFSVWDTGMGIEDEDLDRIFEEFEQVDSSKATEGTGLGLALTRKLVELHGGYIDVESTCGEGTTFNVYIPVLEAEDLREEEDTPFFPLPVSQYPVPGQNEGPLVLVAEDDVSVSEILTIYLTQAGYRVAHAYDGVEAIEKAREEKPFAIALDIMLPKKDGWEVLQTLKTDSATCDIPVIIHSMIENRELAFALGATDYLVKPATKQCLLDKLRSLTPVHGKGRHPVTVLAVTGDMDVQDSLGDFLDREGFLFHFADDEQYGFELALSTKPDIIVIDTAIAKGGFDIINRYKSHSMLKDIPLFVLTSQELTADERSRMTGQIEGILRKDALDSRELLDHLNGLKIFYPHKAGLIDELTGLFNARYFEIRFSQEISRAERYKFPLGLALLHMDHFDHFSEQKGSYYASLAVKKIAALLKRKLRASDVLVRHDRDRFAIILTNTPLQAIDNLAARLVGSIYDYPFLQEEVQPLGRITASIGVAEYRGQSADDLLASANAALSRAMEKGGNRVEVAR